LNQIKNIFLLTLLIASTEQSKAASCSTKKTQEILQPATAKNSSVHIDCSFTLPPQAQVTKQLIFEGEQASYSIVDCNDAYIHATHAEPSVLIRSKLQQNIWQAPNNIQIKNCSIAGSLRIHGMASNGEGKYLRESSLTEGHTERAQLAAPHHIVLDHLTMVAGERNMMYFAPGVHHVTLKNSHFSGNTAGLALYLDAESADNLIEHNRFNVQTKSRETIAIDGSANNMIRQNQFIHPNNGAIYLYRNCGEGGTVRHQKPSNNHIINNRFELTRSSKRPVIWLGSRNGQRNYCQADRGYAFGSSVSDADLAQHNVVTANHLMLKKMSKFYVWIMGMKRKLIRVDAQPNQVTVNQVTVD
jgi:hypothetical protein